MKFLVLLFLLTNPMLNGGSQDHFSFADTLVAETPALRVIASVKDRHDEYILIVIEKVIAYNASVKITPASGDEIMVRLPGGEMVKKESRIDIDLQEKIEVGEMPCSYIMVEYRTID